MADKSNMKLFMAASAIAIILLSMVVLVGIAIVQEFSLVLRSSTGANPEIISASMAAPGTANDIGTTGQYPFLQTVTGCFNSTTNGTEDALSTALYEISVGDSDGGTLTLLHEPGGGNWTGESVNCTSLTYLADTSAQASADTFVIALAIFGTFAAVIVLALVGKVIIGLFKKK